MRHFAALKWESRLTVDPHFEIRAPVGVKALQQLIDLTAQQAPPTGDAQSR